MKKRIKICFSFLIACVVIVMPLLAFGEQGMVMLTLKTQNASVELLQEGSFDNEITENATAAQNIMLYTEEGADAEAVMEYMHSCLLNCDSRIYILPYEIPIGDFICLYCDLINDNPDLFFVSSSVRYSYTSSGYIHSVYPDYCMTAEEIEDAMLIFEAGAEKALSNVDDSMSDLQKALVLHDYLCDIATYPSDAYENDKPSYHSAYGLFYDGNAVCAGNALTYSYLLKRLDIPCEYVVSDSMQHAWNAVQIDGKWYNVDITFDDISAYGDNKRGAFTHKCFMKSDTALSGDMGFYHYDMLTRDNLFIDNTDYDDYFWNNVNTNICVINGKYYYLDLDENLYLFKRSESGVVSKVFSYSFPYSASTLRGNYYDAEGNPHMVSFTDIHARLVQLDKRLYINGGPYIFSLSKNGNSYVRYHIMTTEDSSYIIGLGKDDGELVYNTRNGEAVRLDKLEYFNNNVSVSDTKGYNNYADINLDGYVNVQDYLYIKNSKK